VNPNEMEKLLQALTPKERQELDKLLAASPLPAQFEDSNFKEQTAFLRDKSPLKVVLCTRRSGKSYAAGLELFAAASARPYVSCLYVALTRASAKRIMWKDVLKTIDREKKLGCRYNETDLSVTLSNGSVIYLLGLDAGEDEKEKALGQKFANVVIDEAASYSIDLNELVYGILKPAVADYRGQISMIGTPGNVKRGLYYDLTEGQDPGNPGCWAKLGWSGHRWSAKDNPHMADKWAAEIESLIEGNPRIQETPLFKQHYLGQWVMDDDARVYKFDATRNGYRGKLPDIPGDGRWHFVVGLDLGFNDATAWSIAAYHDNSKVLYIVETWKSEKLDITDTAEKTRQILNRYDIERVIVDGANKQAVEEMRKRHHLPLVIAQKSSKADFIGIMNGDMICGNIKVNMDSASDLIDEYDGLVWDVRIIDRRVEHPSCPNHCADATLYAWRNCYNYMSELKAINAAPGTPEAFLLEARELEEQEVQLWEQSENEKRMHEWNGEWI